MADPADLRVKRSALRVLVLSIISLGLYDLYWFYVTRKQLDGELGENRSLKVAPVWQVFLPMILVVLAGLAFLPALASESLTPLVGLSGAVILGALIVTVVVWYSLFKDLGQVRASQGLEATPPWLYIVGYIALSFVSPANVALVAYAAYQLNQYWDMRSGGRATEARYTAGEILVSLAGVVLAVLFFMALLAVSVANPEVLE